MLDAHYKDGMVTIQCTNVRRCKGLPNVPLQLEKHLELFLQRNRGSPTRVLENDRIFMLSNESSAVFHIWQSLPNMVIE